MATIRVGIGGWTFPPWRGAFYPPGLPHAQELAFASRRLTSIEINATFHGSQKPASFRRWREETPDGFAFSLKAPRAATWRRELAEAGPSVARFLASGVAELGERLGPMLWQFPPTRRFDRAQIESFLSLLPPSHEGLRLRHAIEAPHESFGDPEFAELLRRHNVAWAMVDADGYPAADGATADFAYARLKRNDAAEKLGYACAALRTWRDSVRKLAAEGRDCFVYCIAGDKQRAPDAAMELLRMLGD